MQDAFSLTVRVCGEVLGRTHDAVLPLIEKRLGFDIWIQDTTVCSLNLIWMWQSSARAMASEVVCGLIFRVLLPVCLAAGEHLQPLRYFIQLGFVKVLGLHLNLYLSPLRGRCRRSRNSSQRQIHCYIRLNEKNVCKIKHKFMKS